MANEAHVRIDEGVKRGKQLRREALKQPRSKKGVFLSQLDPEKRKAIILEAPERILRGETTTQIAQSYDIPASTLRSWLVGNPDAEQARGAMLAMELTTKIGEIENANDPLSLAQAREGFRAWSWIAERREARLYGQKQEVTVKQEVRIETVLDGEACELLGKMLAQSVASNTHCTAIEGQSVVIPNTTGSTD